MERISFIDLGSNSVRFVISEISSAGSYSLIYQEKESIRLSENMWGENKLTEEAMSRAIRSLKAFAHMAEAMESNKTYAVATAAVRLAKNGDDFIGKPICNATTKESPNSQTCHKDGNNHCDGC